MSDLVTDSTEGGRCSKEKGIGFFHRVKPTLPWITLSVILHILVVTHVIPHTQRLVYGIRSADGSFPEDKLPVQFRNASAPDPRFNYPFDPSREDLPEVPHTGAILIVPFVLNVVLFRATAFMYHVTTGLVTSAIISVLKESVGAIRPNFYQRCEYNMTTKECDNKKEEQRARVSFPSGHSGNTAAVMGFWALDWVALISTRWPRARPYASIFVTIPLFVTFYVSGTRYVDYYHFPHDIIAGIAIGAVCAYFFFVIMVWSCSVGDAKAKGKEEESYPQV